MDLPVLPVQQGACGGGLAGRYFVALRREVDWYVAAHGDARQAPFTSLYIIGGTPTLYPDELADVIPMIPVSGERTMEVLPNHGTPEPLDGLAAMGITAVGIGAQSFHDGVLRRDVGLAQMSCPIDVDRRAARTAA